MSPHGSGLTPAQLWARFQQYPYHLARAVLVVAAVLGVYAIIHSIESVLFPVTASLLLAYVADPLVDRIEARGYQRTTAIMVLLCTIGLGATGLVLFLYPTIAQLLGSIVERLPGLVDLARDRGIPWFEETFGVVLPHTVSAMFDQYGEAVRGQLPGVAKSASKWAAGLWSQTGAVVASLLNIVLIPVLTFYFLRDFDRMKATAAEFVPMPWRDMVFDRLARADEVVGAWLRGQVEVALILAVLYAIGLGVVFGWIGVGVMTGVAVGFAAGLLNFIPYFGFLVGFLLSVSIVILEWSGWGALAAILVVFAVVQGLEGWLITPRIVGEKVGMSPVTVILVLLVGGELLGLVGVVVAIPVAGAMGVVMPDIVNWYRSTTFYLGEDAPQADANPEGDPPASTQREEPSAEGESDSGADEADAEKSPAGPASVGQVPGDEQSPVVARATGEVQKPPAEPDTGSS